ncbi:hypothetical protein [Pseudonocardia spinosispora]|uniref:hypothetical protein n=2 Tax=Pseudonocardia spinosispora TaxID=103441 RepID=UPI000402BD40|nr:hypothetical protein [Pseudonocardia spinosispora]
MDQRKLTEMFSDAADDADRGAPPATFGHDDVLAGSRRARERSRRRMTGGVAIAAVVLVGAGLFSAGRLTAPSGDSTTLAQPSSAPAEAPAQPYAAAPDAAQKRVAPSDCSEPDQQLFDQLSAVLPQLKGVTPRPLGDQVSCPRGARGFEVDVTDGAASGTLRVLLSPNGGGMTIQRGHGGSIITTSTSTESGGSLSLSAISDSGPAPYGKRINQLAHTLADQN